jgi:Zn-dependent protease
MDHLANAPIYYVVFLFSTTLHEAAHAWAALRGGDRTAYLGGQVTLDPRPHIRREPFGMVLLPVLSLLLSGWPFGFASAPYDPRWAIRNPARAAIMSLAGPGANLLLVVASGLLLRLGEAFGVFGAPQAVTFGHLADAAPDGIWPAVAFLLSVLFSLNLLLFVFNLLPLPPLDGSGAVPLLLSERSAERYLLLIWSNPMLSLFGLLVAWRIIDVLFSPIFVAAVSLLYPGATYS